MGTVNGGSNNVNEEKNLQWFAVSSFKTGFLQEYFFPQLLVSSSHVLLKSFILFTKQNKEVIIVHTYSYESEELGVHTIIFLLLVLDSPFFSFLLSYSPGLYFDCAKLQMLQLGFSFKRNEKETKVWEQFIALLVMYLMFFNISTRTAT